MQWVEGISKTVKGVIATDGKTLRRSHDQRTGKKALHIVSAWAVENRLVLAQLATEEKSNEITAILLLLKQLALKGCIVTIDAMGTQTRIAEQIREQEGEYALALKDDPGNLYDEVKATFALAKKDGFSSLYWESDRQVEKGHGRLEIREHWTLSDQEILTYLGRSRNGKACEALGWFALSDAWSRRQRKTRATSCSVFPRSKPLLLRSEATGELKTACIGSSISRFGKMNRACGKGMPTKISRLYATSA